MPQATVKTQRENKKMNILVALIDWLNAETAGTYPLQHDGVYPMMSWKNLRVADTMNTPSFSTLAWLTVLVMALPVLVLV